MSDTSDSDRGIHYADGGTGAYDSVHYPNPEKIAACHAEWDGISGPYSEVE